MITAVDTAALISIDRGVDDASRWVEVLADARTEGALVICDVVATEFYAVVMEDRAFDRVLSDLGITHQAASAEAARLAGRIFRHYRDGGGPRAHLIPDFLIAAHAAVDCDRLASKDRGYLRRYFPKLPLLSCRD